MAITWRDIEGYEGLYQVSNYGQVRGKNRKDSRGYFIKGKILSPRIGVKGYKYIVLSKNKSQKTFYIHRLVAKAFIPNPKKLTDVHHIDENRTNNDHTNLTWLSHQDNLNSGNRKTKMIYTKTSPIYLIGIDRSKQKYSGVKEASDTLNLTKSGIYRVLNKERKTCGGYIFTYAKKEGELK